MAFQWIDFISSFFLFLFFLYQRKYKGRCKFEVLYVTGVGTFTDWMKIFLTGYVPASFNIQQNGNFVGWSRWVGWLITCPVLLIHLANLPGKEIFNVRRLMKMLIGFQVMVACGATAAMAEGAWKWLFAFAAWMAEMVIFKHAKDVFEESHVTMPVQAGDHLNRTALVFFSSWTGFGIFFCAGPEMAGSIDADTTKAAYAIFDILSKNVYAWHGWHLRWRILRKANKPDEFIDEIKEEDEQKEYKVLLIERDEVFSYFFYNTLVQHQCVVDSVKTLNDALGKLTTVTQAGSQYDVIMINHEMAKENNYAMMQELRRAAFMLPVLAYGRNIDPQDVNNRNATGIDDFLVAPFPDNEIEKKMMKWSRRMSVDPRRASMPFQTLGNQTGQSNRLAGMLNMPPAAPTSFSSGPPPPSGSAPGPGPVKMTLDCDTFEEKQDKESAAEKQTADLNMKLEMLMKQLEEVKTSTKQATEDFSRRLEEQEHRGQSHAPSPVTPPSAQQMHPQMSQQAVPQQAQHPPQQTVPQQAQQAPQQTMPQSNQHYSPQQMQHQSPPQMQGQMPMMTPQQMHQMQMNPEFQQFLQQNGMQPTSGGAYTFI